MQKSKFSATQIVSILKGAEAGIPVKVYAVSAHGTDIVLV